MRARIPLLRTTWIAAALALGFEHASASTITIVNLDDPGEGFNDPTPVAPVGGNPGTTLGAQRVNVFVQAAAIWGAILPSPVEIRVEANFDPFGGTATSAVLGAAGANTVDIDFPGAVYPNTWYTQAEANKLAGVDRAPENDIGAVFNSDVDNPVVLGSRDWYYGYDGNEGSDIELLSVVLHEICHGLGFLTLVDDMTFQEFMGSPDVYERFMFDNTTGKHWNEMTDGERATSALNNGHLVWDGPAVTFKAPLVLGPRPRLIVNAPAPIAGTMLMGRGSGFGAELTTPGLTADVVLANDGSGTTSDACQPLINGGQVAGRIALVDRSAACTDLVKTQNVQAAGATGVLFVDNVSSTQPPNLRGYDPSLTIPVGSVRQSDGNSIRAQLGAGVNVTLTVDPTKLSGADESHRPWLYAPNSFAGGSSLSHWDGQAYPNLLMEPNYNWSTYGNGVDLAKDLFEDIGWQPQTTDVGGDPSPRAAIGGSVPNPFSSRTSLRFAIVRSGAARLTVLDAAGRRVRTLASGWMEAGTHARDWDGTDDQGARVRPGLYFFRVQSQDGVGTGSVVMLH